MKKLISLIIAISVLNCTSQEKNLPKEFDFGKIDNGTYENNFFDMKVSFNPTWIVQDKQQMNKLIETGNELVTGEDKEMKLAVKASMVNTAYLLSIFKHEIGAAVDFNPSFIIVAENIKNFPGIKNGKDYLFHLKKILKQSQMKYYFEKDVVEKQIDGAVFYVVEAKLDYMGKTIVQEYIVTLTKGFSLSFIISYTNEEEKKELYDIIDQIRI